MCVLRVYGGPKNKEEEKARDTEQRRKNKRRKKEVPVGSQSSRFASLSS